MCICLEVRLTQHERSGSKNTRIKSGCTYALLRAILLGNDPIYAQGDYGKNKHVLHFVSAGHTQPYSSLRLAS